MNVEEKAARIVAAAHLITVASIDEQGYPRPVPMIKLKEEQGAIYVSTATGSAKTAHFRANPKAGVSIVKGNDSVVYTGEMEIVTDETLKRSLWGEWMLDHFPGGADDPEYCVLKFTPRSATYWIDALFVKEGKIVNLYCQSCGMPMQSPDLFGMNADGSPNSDYCCYCYKEGAFTMDCTMEEMIEHCVRFIDEFNQGSDRPLTEQEAIAQMRRYFPMLKRWSGAETK